MNRGRALGPGTLAKRGEFWTLTYTDELGRRRRTALSSDRKVAERLRVELIRRRDLARAGLGAESGQDLSLPEVAHAYLEDLRPRVSPRHYANVSARLESTLARLDGVRVRDLRPMDVVRLRNEACARGASHRTANLVVSTLQSTLRWAVENQLVAASPIEHVKPLPYGREHYRYRRRALTEDELRRFLDASKAEDAELEVLSPTPRVPQTPMWLALIESGARFGELRQVVWGDVDLGRRTLVLRAETTKSRKQRAVPLGDVLTDRLRVLRALHETVRGRLANVADVVFMSPEGRPWAVPTTNPMRILDRLLARAKIAKVDAEGRKLDLHALRTTCASRLARNGVPLAIAQRWLGHSDPKLTAAHYVDVGVEDLRAATEHLPAPGASPEVRQETKTAT